MGANGTAPSPLLLLSSSIVSGASILGLLASVSNSGAGGEATKGFKSAISKIAQDTFNTGQNKFAAQFTQSRKNVANYL